MDEANPKDLIGIKKPRLYLVPPASILYQALAMQNGAEKYGPYNWRTKKVVASIYIDAALRHIASWLDREEYADDSHLPHLAHGLACLGILVDAIETGNLVDDRPTAGPMADLIRKWTNKDEVPTGGLCERPIGGPPQADGRTAVTTAEAARIVEESRVIPDPVMEAKRVADREYQESVRKIVQEEKRREEERKQILRDQP